MRVLRILISTFVFLLFCVAGARAQDAETSPTLSMRGLLRIGYLRREETGHPGESALDDMRKALTENKVIDEALRRAGYSGIGIFPCDGASDMLRRLNAREFEIAFTPASLYLQQKSNYTAVLMARRPGDTFSATNTVWRYGVVIVSKRSPLFAKDQITSADIQSALHSGGRIGVVSTQSVAGYYAPLLTLATKYNADPVDPGLTFYETSGEVVKAVLAGLVDVGACEEAAIARVMKENNLEGEQAKLLRVIVRTDPAATDPIVILSDLAERNTTLVRLLTSAMRDYFVAQRSDIQYVPTEDREYGRLREMLKEFNLRFGRLNP